jgi:hypothetical protein
VELESSSLFKLPGRPQGQLHSVIDAHIKLWTNSLEHLNTWLLAVIARRFAVTACRDCEFAFCRGHGCLSLGNAAWYQEDFSARGRSHVQRSPIGYGVSV